MKPLKDKPRIEAPSATREWIVKSLKVVDDEIQKRNPDARIGRGCILHIR